MTKGRRPSNGKQGGAVATAKPSADFEAQRVGIMNEMLEKLANVSSTFRDMSALATSQYGGERDLVKTFGYKAEGERSYDTYYDYYKSTDIANRIINMIPRSCWRDGAWLTLERDSEEQLFEAEMQRLANAGLFRELERADILNRIGAFSVLYIGVPDGLDPREPVGSVTKTQNALEQFFFAPYSERSVTVASTDTDEKSPRYGLPLLYTLTPNQQRTSSTLSDRRKPRQVHWTRVSHIAEGALASPGEGRSALEPILNRLDDWNKAIGGSGEAFYRNAAQKFAMKVDKDARITSDEWTAFDAKMNDFLNEFQNVLGISGADITPITVPSTNPEPTVDTILKGLTAGSGIPERLLIGQGAGQLAGNEDKASYNQLISDRQNQFCSPMLLDTLSVVQRTGLIKLPDNVVVGWPLAGVMNESERANVELTEAQTRKTDVEALTTWADSIGAPSAIPLEVFLKEFLDKDDEFIDTVLAKVGELEALGTPPEGQEEG